MISRLQIQGFKSFGPEGVDLPLAPITVILGANSIGKSSILQALVALHQSWEEPPDVYWFTPKGRAIDVGRFCNVVHRRGPFHCATVGITTHQETSGSTRRVELQWTEPGIYPVGDVQTDAPEWSFLADGDAWRMHRPTDPTPADRGKLALITLGTTFRFTFLPNWNEAERSLELTLSHDTIERWIQDDRPGSDQLRSVVRAGYGFVWHITATQDEFVQAQLQQIAPPEESDEDPDLPDEDLSPAEEVQVKVSVGQTDALAEIREQIERDHQRGGYIWGEATRRLSQLGHLRKSIRTMSYIDGLRDRGKRLYDLNLADHTWRVGRNGERMVDVLEGQPDTRTRANEMLSASNLGYQVALHDPRTHAQVREVLISTNTRHGQMTSSLVDVGTGIAQILPIVVQLAAFADRNRFPVTPLLLVEQPELHLHPRLQAQLARLFATAIAPRADSDSTLERQPVQIIAETHSEHLVLGLGVLIYEGLLSPDDVCVLKLVADENENVKAQRIRFTDDGRFLDDWPEGFFPERHQLEAGQLP